MSVLLFQKRFHAGLVDGSITLTFRAWPRPRVKPQGRYRVHPIGVVEVTGITASDGSGRIDGSARARFDGLDFSGANARFEIAKARPFDVMLGGQALGSVYGRADVGVRRSAQATRVSVELPSLHVRLSDLAGKAVQELPQRADIKVGVLKGGALVDARPPRARRGAIWGR